MPALFKKINEPCEEKVDMVCLCEPSVRVSVVGVKGSIWTQRPALSGVPAFLCPHPRPYGLQYFYYEEEGGQ